MFCSTGFRGLGLVAFLLLWTQPVVASPSKTERLECARARAYVEKGASLDHFLQGCSFFARRILWEEPNGDRVPYREWPEIRRDRLHQLYDELLAARGPHHRLPPLRCPLPARTPGGERYFFAEEAFDVYAAHVAWSFVLELQGMLPWSLFSLSDPELSEILDSSSYHARIRAMPPSPSAGSLPYAADRDFQAHARAIHSPHEILCDPRTPYRFLEGSRASDGRRRIRATPDETLGEVLEWFAKNVVHGSSIGSSSWSYLNNLRRAQPYLEHRLAVVRPRGSPEAPHIYSHDGCQSTALLFHDLLRGIHLPPLLARSADRPPLLPEFPVYVSGMHGALVFSWTGATPRFLPHADHLQRAMFSTRTFYDGSLLTGDAFRQFLRDTLLGDATRLSTWGFSVFADYPLVRPDHPWMIGVSEQRLERYFDAGRLSGVWHSEALVPGVLPAFPSGYVPYENELDYQLCNYEFLRDYCDLGYVKQRSASSAFPRPFLRSQEELDHRAAVCIKSIGGCDALAPMVESIRMQTSVGFR